jgi:hypothetical protein
MSATNTTGAADEFESDPGTSGAESIHTEHHAHTENINAPRAALGATPLASLGIVVAIGLGVLMQSAEVRRVCRSVLQDPEVQKVCREAGESVCREVAASWRRNGGTAILAHTFLR